MQTGGRELPIERRLAQRRRRLERREGERRTAGIVDMGLDFPERRQVARRGPFSRRSLIGRRLSWR